MIHKFPVGTKEQNDLLILPQGAVTIDGVNSIRVHNGEQLGGGVIGLEQAYEPPPIPFKGEVSRFDLIESNELISLVNLTAGTALGGGDDWLHFVDPVDGKTKYILKQACRRNLSWNSLNNRGLIYGKEITIQGKQYICRSIKSTIDDPYSGNPSGIDAEETWGSEWNRLMYPICAPTGNSIYDTINDPTSPGLGAWAQYDQRNELGLTVGDGRICWCQESRVGNRITRGGTSVTNVHYRTSSYTNSVMGFRPLLELVE